MEKFGMNFGGGPNKKELLETIESQKKQLAQYQTRFKDVVRAYKSLLKEKEALEASLKVLTVSQEANLNLRNEQPSGGTDTGRCSSDHGDDKFSVHSEDSVGTVASADTATSVASSSTKGELNEDERGLADQLDAGPASQKSEENNGSESGISCSSGEQQAAGEADRRVFQLKTQLSTLTNSLATVTQEKSRMEASFQADKKMMKQDFDDLTKKLEEEMSKHEAEVKGLQEQLAETKARVITQQHERAQEQGDHVLMLRELQNLLQEERDLRQDAELRLEEMKEALVEKMSAADRVVDCESQMKQLSKKMDGMKKSLQAAEEEKCKPDPRVGELQQQIAELKAHFQGQLQQEMKKVAQAQEQLQEHSQMEEGRVASLEDRISELSELLGTYEKAKQKDQLTIQMFRDHILQLDMENKSLAKTATTRTSVDLTIDEANLNVNMLKDKLEKLKKLLLLAAQKSQQSIDIEKLCEASDGEKASVAYYQQELKQLKEEFERYKMRAQVVLKNKNAKDGSMAKELEEAHNQLSELKEKYISLRLSCDEMEIKHKQELEVKQQHTLNVQQGQKQRLEKLEKDYHERALKLEEELHKQRDRTLALLTEKDQELERLRSMSFGYSLTGHKSYSENNAAVEREGNSGSSDCPDESQDIIAQALKLAGPNEPNLLLCAEQLARKQVEVSTLRKLKHGLEGEVRKLQDTLLTNEERHSEEISLLKDHIQKSTRDQSREGANLEYLKNIIYRFLTLQDTLGRQQTLTAILTILHFSPQEKQAVLKYQASSWWSSGAR
ncbi:GRIP and coiled-coil domain-containing protein 1-like [Polyodon spathula]|uniref:GRIP and coiled-coil domain-containing protein 1-like n=1 Tax=Polyodon spathula TaxID=7913 RepID=UPI001B7ED2EA|nr:GRIP and coiled-coil domain-containing protein 1-like [Polyodon spathula]XP_041110506.1 GRIP and coiled-coil domain-containing protein 1-like [Polyodon spathula]